MPIERFSKEEFEQALPADKQGNPMWTCLGLVDGEYVYEIEVQGTNKRIVVRSSIDRSGYAAEVGQDSIRHWIEYEYKGEWRALGKHDTRWTARTKNWREHLVNKLRDLYKVALEDSNNREHKTAAEEKAAILLKAKASEQSGKEVRPEVPGCPDCGKPMVERHRRSDDQPFWGCSQFPNCRGARPFSSLATPADRAAVEPKVKKEFVPTAEQQAIFEYIQNPDGTDAVVEALAGTGKTTTIVEALKYTKGKVLFCAFNKRIADELRKRAPSHVSCATLHSVGYQALLKAFPSKPIVDSSKKYNIAKELLPGDDTDTRFVRTTLVNVASKVQATLTDPTDREAVLALMDYYNIVCETSRVHAALDDPANQETAYYDIEGAEEAVLIYLPRMIKLCLERTTVIDYDDMIYMPVVLNVPTERYDWVFVDECQDLNLPQLQLIQKLTNDYSRVVTVGDRHQSIYAFRGADSEAVPRLIRELNQVKTLPLTISWRCPKSHVELAQQLVTEFKAAPDAIEGEVIENFNEWQLHKEVRDGDMILCRINAPLVSTCYALIKQDVKATIIGRDIGKGLILLIDKLGPYDITDLLIKVREYKFKEIAKLEAAGKDSQAQALEDKCDTLTALTEGVDDLTMLRARIEQIFTDKITGVSLSSVHRAKGLEADTVYILKPELMPFPKASKPWELDQEANICYVAMTRSKRKLVFIGGSAPTWREPDPYGVPNEDGGDVDD